VSKSSGRSYLNLRSEDANQIISFLEFFMENPSSSKSEKRRAGPILRLFKNNLSGGTLRQIYVTESQKEFLRSVVSVLNTEKPVQIS